MRSDLLQPFQQRRHCSYWVTRIIQQAYDVAEIIGLAVAAVMAVGAIFMISQGPQIRARIDQQIAEEVAEENQMFCEKRGLVPGTHDFTTCEIDLNDIRTNHEKRINQYSDILL